MKSFVSQYDFNYPIEEVYAHWISPNTIIPPVSALVIDARVGGIYKLVMPGGMAMVGKFLIVEPNLRLCYTWQRLGDPEITKVAVEFVGQANNTTVKIKHSGFQSDESLENHSVGWGSYIQGLRAYLSTVTRVIK